MGSACVSIIERSCRIVAFGRWKGIDTTAPTGSSGSSANVSPTEGEWAVHATRSKATSPSADVDAVLVKSELGFDAAHGNAIVRLVTSIQLHCKHFVEILVSHTRVSILEIAYVRLRARVFPRVDPSLNGIQMLIVAHRRYLADVGSILFLALLSAMCVCCWTVAYVVWYDSSGSSSRCAACYPLIRTGDGMAACGYKPSCRIRYERFRYVSLRCSECCKSLHPCRIQRRCTRLWTSGWEWFLYGSF